MALCTRPLKYSKYVEEEYNIYYFQFRIEENFQPPDNEISSDSNDDTEYSYEYSN